MQIKRSSIFLVICAIALATVVAYLRHAQTRVPQPQAAKPVTVAAISNTAAHAKVAANAPVHVAEPAQPSAPIRPEALRLFYRHNGVDSHYGSVAYVRTDGSEQASYIDTLRCEVVHASGSRGICLTADRGVFTTYTAKLFDADSFKVTASLPLNGIPSRSRMSVDGKLAAFTVFVSGHGYTTLDFSTQTLLLDATTGAVIADLEDFKVTRAGEPFSNNDFNLWGVTFTSDGKQFYATLSTSGNHYLIRGDIASRTATVVHENVECPSLSPNGMQVAYKKRFVIDNRIVWQLHVLDLKSDKETPLSEKRSIDDQLEWLDDKEVLYSVPSDEGAGASTDVWVAPASGTAPPRLFLKNAYSPAAERGVES